MDVHNEPPCVRHATYPRNNKLIDSCERPAVSNESERERKRERESSLWGAARRAGEGKWLLLCSPREITAGGDLLLL